MRFGMGTLLVATLAITMGCEGDISPAPATSGTAPAPPAPAPPGDDDAAPETTGDEATAQPTATAPQPAAAPSAPAPAAGGTQQPTAAAKPESGNAKVADVGAGRKGRDYGGPGFVTTPVQEYFRARDNIAFRIQIPNAMKIYKASHDNKGPKTQQEFMDVIVKENGVQLPELPNGEEYVYDPKTEQLLVRRAVQ